MQDDRSKLAIINLELSHEFTKNSHKLQRELLQLFLKEIPDIQKKINVAFQKRDKKELNAQIHTLTGSCIYCGLDRLKASLTVVKYAAEKNNYEQTILDDLNQELKTVVKEAIKFVN